MSSGLLLDPLPSPGSEPASVGPRFRPYASAEHHVTKARYITSNDPRGYIPVYEYPLNGQWIMLDMDDGYVLWTGIWKALGNSKADIVKIIDSQPDLAAQLRRVRGGYLKIQGTWMPFEIALRLARRVAWPIRHDLIPYLGQPSRPPDAPATERLPRHAARPVCRARVCLADIDDRVRLPPRPCLRAAELALVRDLGQRPFLSIPQPAILHGLAFRCIARPERHRRLPTITAGGNGAPADITSIGTRARHYHAPPDPTTESATENGARDAFHLPPISAMDNLQDAQHSDSLAVLRRLQSVDDADAPLQRRHSLAEPAYKVSDMSFANARLPSLRTPLSASAALPPSSLPPLRHGRDSSSSIAASSLHHSVPRDREAYVSRLSSPPSSSLDAHTASDKVVPTPDDEQYLRSRPTAQNGIITTGSGAASQSHSGDSTPWLAVTPAADLLESL
ncbi:hypothetical protein A0H81_07376 [Grifola frondosa]|uniref:HTH APSES-type domain-containing protein n=1 Tax=Grifola frondosa TaxID=5627 RepID=A0A1C7M4W0_GRIFR|nr:hypothetical protein A0H81_07376 [Grifola frondosa]